MNTSTILSSLGLLGLILSPVACHRSSSSSAAPPVITKVAASVTVVAVVTDAKSGQPVPNVTFTVTGQAANLVVDGAGNSLFNATGGFAGPMTGVAGVYPVPIIADSSATYPLNLTLVTSAAGYLGNSTAVTVPQTAITSDGTGTLTAQIQMVSVANPPVGVVAATAPVTADGSGQVSAPVTVTTPASIVTQAGATLNLGSASVTIPAGTSFYTDATHSTPVTGALTVTQVYHNNQTLSSLATYPPFTINEDDTGAPVATPRALQLGGLTTITITDAAGNQVHSFSQPITVTCTFNGATILAGKNRTPQAGDVVSIYSYDDATGWSVLKDANGNVETATLPQADANGNFAVTVTTNHLSQVGVGISADTARADITLIGLQEDDNIIINLHYSCGYLVRISLNDINGNIVIPVILLNQIVSISVDIMIDGINLPTQFVQNANKNGIVLNFSAIQRSIYYNVSGHAKGYNSAGILGGLASITITATTAINGKPYYYVTNTSGDGSYKLSLPGGATYTIKAIDSNYYPQPNALSVTVTSDSQNNDFIFGGSGT